MKKTKQQIKAFIKNNTQYNFTLFEQRILYRCLKLINKFDKGKDIKDPYKVLLGFDFYFIVMPVSSILKEEKDQNLSLIKETLLSLKSKQISISDHECTYDVNFINRPKISYNNNLIEFIIYPNVINKLKECKF